MKSSVAHSGGLRRHMKKHRTVARSESPGSVDGEELSAPFSCHELDALASVEERPQDTFSDALEFLETLVSSGPNTFTEDDYLSGSPAGLETTLLDNVECMPHLQPSSGGLCSPMQNGYQVYNNSDATASVLFETLPSTASFLDDTVITASECSSEDSNSHRPSDDLFVRREYHPYLTGQICDRNGNFLPPNTPPGPDEHSNGWYPFRDRSQFELAEFLFSHNQMSAGDIDKLMKLSEDPPFADHKDLYRLIDDIEHGDVKWNTASISYSGPAPPGPRPSWMDKMHDI
ncbi:hypothetical protein AGABI1DRAFT_95965, partial [Agaricus bisporus var. burnettii JB137-S8]